MKKTSILLTISAFLLLHLLFQSCDNDDVNDNLPSVLTAKMEAKVDGEYVKFTLPQFVRSTYTNPISGDSIQDFSIAGVKAGASLYPKLIMYLKAETGTHDFDNDSNMLLSNKRFVGLYMKAQDDEYRSDNQSGVTGKVTISSLTYEKDGTVKGTFYFTGRKGGGSETVSITEGVFEGKFSL